MNTDILKLDCAAETARICENLIEWIQKRFKRRGAVVGISGGVDSSVTAALCVRALGKERVLGLFMPEIDSASETPELSHQIVEHLGVECIQQDLSRVLEALRCYELRNEAICMVLPEYQPSWRFKIVLPSLLEQDALRVFSVVAQSPDGREHTARLSPEAYLQLVAATNFKQRTRKMLEYCHADMRQYVVVGTPNRLEYELGFFVKFGDGAADVKPIAHLYKTQVYQLAEHLDLPEAIQSQAPSTDTYSLPQTQEEFYFAVPYAQMDLCLYGRNHGLRPQEVASTSGLTAEQVERVYRDIDAKRKVASYLNAMPIAISDELG